MQGLQLRCREHGLRLTPQRMEIYRTLIEMPTHPTAEEVYKQVRLRFRSISFDTVNRTLLTLAQVGAAFVVEGTGQPRRYDAGLEDHQHFRCLNCGGIVDFHHEPFDHIEVPAELEGVKILRKTVYFEGLCAVCAPAVNHIAKRSD
ncbi:MAG: transcriptional repressor [Planctomycetaceae bacterium]|nr:transcriptional repressor [Planctomycetaceae bacterium]